MEVVDRGGWKEINQYRQRWKWVLRGGYACHVQITDSSQSSWSRGRAELDGYQMA